jgi:uncharacterized protein (DUF608 family)
VTRIRAKEGGVAGVPLGGIGAGKLELQPNGLFGAFTFLNNWSEPLTGPQGYPGVLGYHFGLASEPADGQGKRKARLLQTAPLPGLPTLRDIDYEGLYPRATLTYPVKDLGLEATLEGFSPWTPPDVKRSGLPAAFFTLRVKNVTRRPLRAGFLFIGRNVCGEWCVGRANRVEDSRKALHLDFRNDDPSPRDVRQGAMRFSFVKRGWDLSFMEAWNAVTRNFSFGPGDVALPAWDFFLREGRLPDTRSSEPSASGENRELCGAVAAFRTLKPGEEAKLDFTASWHFPRHPFGHRYAAWFKDAAAVSRYALAQKDALGRGVRALERATLSMPFPRWFNEALLANLAPFGASTWLTKDGRFSFYEAPVVCPLMGTVDVGFYGSIPLSYFFPELEKSLILQFAAAQRPDGYVPHDLGKNRLDLPSDGTTFHRWKDLNPKFILMAYRDWLWSGDAAFFERLYPHVKKALAWSVGTDFDGNGLPDNEGQDQTFDLWGLYGTNAYTSSIYLAALLACERMAERARDLRFAEECRGRFALGSRSFERELWNGRFFGETCSLSQLNGQWYADLLGLGPIVERAKVRTAIAEILRLNSRHSRHGLVNSVHPDGRPDVSNTHARNIWAGMNHAFLALCLMEGVPLARVMREEEKLWRNFSRVQKSPWNQPDMIDSATGKYLFGDFYYRNMAIWSIPIAAARRDARVARALAVIRSLGGRPARA